MQEPRFSSRLLARLASLQVALVLLLLIGVAAIPGTVINNRHAYYGSLPFLTLLSLLAGSLLLCTLRRWRTLALGVLLVHAGILVTLAGFVVRELAGTVATINVYEGESAAKFYLPYRDVDVDLGFSVLVQQVASEYYPVSVKVGVLKGGEKHSLHTLKTGEQFTVLGYRVVAERLVVRDRNLTLAVYAGDRLLGRVDTAGKGDLPVDFPMEFKLVAFQDPQIRRSWLDLRLTAPNHPPVVGVSEINHPLSYNGFDLYYVQKAADDQGRTFAGIQIVKDPGRSLVFVGLIMATCGTLLAAYRRFHGVG